MRLLSSPLLATLSLLVAVAPAGAAGAPTWRDARALALPPGATGLPQGYLPGLACPAAGDCVAVGDVLDTTGHFHGVIATESGGAWGSPRTIAEPTNAASSADLTPTAVSCAAVGDCVVVGSYYDAAGDTLSFLDVQSRGTWAVATPATLPGDALGAGQVSQLRAVSCAAVGDCAAVGTYTTNAHPGATRGLLLREVKGTWRSAALTLPASSGADPLVSLTQVRCPVAGACLAAGTFVDANNTTHAFVTTATTSSWAAPITPALPANASAYPATTVGAATCADANDCLVVGSYETVTGLREAFVASSRGGAWRRATMVRMPEGAATNPHVFFYGFAGAACPAPGECVTGGQYRDASGRYQGFLVNEAGGVWSGATEMALPPGATSAGANGGVVSFSCASAGECSAGAAYLDATDAYQAYLVSETAHHWEPGTTVVLPGGATTVGVDGGIYGLVCSSTNRCTATGSYLDATGAYQGFTVATG